MFTLQFSFLRKYLKYSHDKMTPQESQVQAKNRLEAVYKNK